MCNNCVSVVCRRYSKMSSGDAFLHRIQPASLGKVLDAHEILGALKPMKYTMYEKRLRELEKGRLREGLTAVLRQLMNRSWRSQGQTPLRGARGKEKLQWGQTTARGILTRRTEQKNLPSKRLSSGTGWPERWQGLYPQRYSKPIWTKLQAACPSPEVAGI